MTIKPRRWQYKARGGMLFADGEIETVNIVVAMEELLTELRARLQEPYTIDMLTSIEVIEITDRK